MAIMAAGAVARCAVLALALAAAWRGASGEPSTTEITISHVTVLLPPSVPASPAPGWEAVRTRHGSLPVRQLVRAFGGCFTWHTNSPQIVLIKEAAHLRCDGGFTGVYLAGVEAPESARRSAWVWAQEVRTQRHIECEVFVDRISRLEILTSTRVVNVGDTESLQMQGFDEQDNVFDTLEGLAFAWTIRAEDDILRRISFSEAGMNTSVVRSSMERGEVATDLLPVQGLRPGKTAVSARLLEEGHPAKPASIVIAVTEPLMLEPTLARLAPACELQFVLKTRYRREVKEGHADKMAWRAIALPSVQYRWSATNASVLWLADDAGLAISQQLGVSRVTVIDKNLEEHRQEAEVHVRAPAAIRLVVHPLRNVDTQRPGVGYGMAPTGAGQPASARPASKQEATWYLVHGSTYLVEVLLLDDAGQRLLVTPNMRFAVSFEGDTAAVDLSANPSWSEITVEARHLGTTLVSARLESITSQLGGSGGVTYKLNPALHTRGVLHVVPPLRVSPRGPIILPQATIGDQAVFMLLATGGSGEYAWRSAAPTVATVAGRPLQSAPNRTDPGGLVSSVSIGTALVTVVDVRNPENSDAVDVIVAHPAPPKFLGQRVEFEAERHLDLVLEVSDAQGRRFSNCSNLRVTTHIAQSESGLTITRVQPCESPCFADSSKSCVPITVTAPRKGFSEIGARLDLGAGDPGAAPATSEPALILVATYLPLIVAPNPILVGVGFPVDLSWAEGPLPFQWPRDSRGAQSHSDILAAFALPASGANAVLGGYDSANTLRSVLVPAVYERLAIVARRDAAAESARAFTLKCVEPHTQLLSLQVRNLASPRNPIPELVSKAVNYSCFARLVLSPRSVRLGVGATRLVAAEVAEPLRSLVRFRVEDPAVATVDHRGVVTGLALGETFLHAEVVGATVGLNDSVPVVVQFENFRIRLGSRHLLRGQDVIVSVEGVNGELPGDAAFERVECGWSADSQVVQILPVLTSLPETVHKHQLLSAHSEARAAVSGLISHLSTSNKVPAVERTPGHSARIIGRRSGKAVVTVHVRVRGPSADSHFEQRAEITVLEPLEVRSSPTLLLPHYSRVSISTSWDKAGLPLRFEVLCVGSSMASTASDERAADGRASSLQSSKAAPRVEDSLAVTASACEAPISVSHDGVVSSYNVSGDAVVMIQAPGALETAQTVSVHVSVRAASSLSIAAPEVATGGWLCFDHSEHSNVTVRVVALDALGRVFSTVESWGDRSDALTSSWLAFVSSRPDLVRVQRATDAKGLQAMQEPGTVGALQLSAVGSEQGGATVRVHLANAPSLAPTFLRVLMARSPACAPVDLELRFAVPVESLSNPNSLWSLPSWDAAACVQLLADLSRALDISPWRIEVVHFSAGRSVSKGSVLRVAGVRFLPGSDVSVPTPMDLALELSKQARRGGDAPLAKGVVSQLLVVPEAPIDATDVAPLLTYADEAESFFAATPIFTSLSAGLQTERTSRGRAAGSTAGDGTGATGWERRASGGGHGAHVPVPSLASPGIIGWLLRMFALNQRAMSPGELFVASVATIGFALLGGYLLLASLCGRRSVARVDLKRRSEVSLSARRKRGPVGDEIQEASRFYDQSVSVAHSRQVR